MTATPRIYKNRHRTDGIEVVDMSDQDVYGPELYRLPFARAVEAGMLSDYRVIVLGVNEASITRSLRGRLEQLNPEGMTRVRAPSTTEMTRVLGLSLAVNGVTEGMELERPGPLRRTMAFANSICRSKWYARALQESQVKSATTRRMKDGRALNVQAVHLDASASALKRNLELRKLDQLEDKTECRVVSNVKLFTEGVDVPQLDAVAFLDPRSSQVDVVQAVGRIMRKAEGKRFGYIIVPVVISPEADIVAALENGTDGYSAVGRVLRALQSHDVRLAEDTANFVKVYEPNSQRMKPPADEEVSLRELPLNLALKEAEPGIYAHVVAASGLGKPGQVVADEISHEVRRASNVFQKENIESQLAKALDLIPEVDGGVQGICTIAALILCNACLLQRRLNDIPDLETERLDRVAGEKDPKGTLQAAWELILEKDYTPVFKPALEVLLALPDRKTIDDIVRSLAECANRVADSLSELGYDHAGPLYHRILGSARSDGAFYTNNLSAVILARLAFNEGFIDWSNPGAVEKLRIMDPACGTGTLLMAALQTIKARIASTRKISVEHSDTLHKLLVEDIFCGLDINQHAIQLAACNMTLGAPTVDYKCMNLVTMPHGPQGGSTSKAGSLEILCTPEIQTLDLSAVLVPEKDLESLEAAQVDASETIEFPLHDLDAVIMNAPFTANKHRSKKYGETGRKMMQRHEQSIKNHLIHRDPKAGDAVTANSIRTFFSPLADILLNREKGTLAKVIPTTACIGASGIAERRFLAERFHIEIVATSHDPRRPNFSENTSIHESLLICRRRFRKTADADIPTRFVALRRMPSTHEEVIEATEAITTASEGKWFKVFKQRRILVSKGDWRPCQFLDPELVGAAMFLEEHRSLVRLENRYLLGPSGQAIRGAFNKVDSDDQGHRIFWSRSNSLRVTMEAKPEQAVVTKEGKKGTVSDLLQKAGNVLLASKFDTISGRLLSIFSEEPGLGSMWVPIQIHKMSLHEAKALCAWFNSTPGALGFFLRRSTKLTNPSFSQAALSSLPVPDFRKVSANVLAEAYEQTKQIQAKAWKHAAKDEMRDCLDQAASATTGISVTKIRDWRCRLAAEPTISNVSIIDQDDSSTDLA